jgi:hypothetical protein
MALRDLSPQELSDFAGQNDPSLIEVDAPNNTVFDEKNNRVLSLPQTLDSDETQFVIDRDIDGKKNFFGQQPIPEDATFLEKTLAMGKAYLQAPKTFIYDIPFHNDFEASRGYINFFAKAPEYIGGLEKAYGEGLVSGRNTLMGPPAGSTASMFSPDASLEETQSDVDIRQSIGKAIGQDADRIIEQNRKYIAQNGYDKRKGDGILFDLGNGGGSLTASVAITGLTRNPASAAIIFGALQKSNIYIEGREKGLESDTSSRASDVAGLMEGALEFVGVHYLFEGLKANTAIKRFLYGGLTEFSQESSQDLAESAVTNTSGIRNNTPQEVGKSALYAGALGFLLGGATSASVGSLVESKAEAGGMSKEQSQKLGKYASDNIDMVKQEMGEFINKEVSPLAADDKSAAEFVTLMQKFDNNADMVDREALSPEQRAAFDQYVEYFNNATRDETGVAGVEKDFFNKLSTAGVEQDQAVAASKLIGARADAASRALGVSPKV